MGPCKAKECDRQAIARGLCQAHYMRLRSTGKVDGKIYSPKHGKIFKKGSKTLKICIDCKRAHPIVDFIVKKGKGPDLRCRECRNQRAYSKYSDSRFRAKLKIYGITVETYQHLLEKQKGCCAICLRHSSEFKESRLYVDHDHRTNEVRGLLCSGCNRGLGAFRDDPKALSKAIEYLAGQAKLLSVG